MIVFVILAVMLVIYYVLRIVVLYIGAVLAPVMMLLWLLPAFKDFVVTAVKVYIMTIFVLFVHVVILLLAASIFTGMRAAGSDDALNPIMAMVVGVATMLALLKTQAVMSQMSYVSLGPKTARKLGGQLSNVISHYSKKSRSGRGDNQSNGNSNRGSNQRGGGKSPNPPKYASTPTKRQPASTNKPQIPVGKTQRAPDMSEQGTANSTPREAKAPRTRVAPKVRKEKE
jgi:hypothetical protein